MYSTPELARMLTRVRIVFAKYTNAADVTTQLSETSYPTHCSAQKSAAAKLLASPRNWLAESLGI